MELLRKLQRKDESHLVVLGSPAELAPLFRDMEEVLSVQHGIGEGEVVPFVIAFVSSVEQLSETVALLEHRITSDTLLWFAYPKTSSRRYRCTITRDKGWEPLGRLGLEPVRQIALDDDWSALRFKPAHSIKHMERRESMALSEEGRARVKER